MHLWIFMPILRDYITRAMTVVTVLYLIGTKTARAFWQAFVIVSSKQNYDSAEIHASCIAVKMVQSSWLITGVLVSILGYVSTALDGANIHNAQDRYAVVALNLALASLGSIYGLIGYLILTPITMKLESIS